MTTILIAEDNATNRELLREILEVHGWSVLEACNGREVLCLMERSQPDAVLMDISMPVMDGFATVHQIRQNPRFRSLPVIAVTAYAMRGDREKILGAGFDGYLSKPVNSRSVVEELKRCLNKAEHLSC
jgi:CheY-like chemotaxis protein